MKAEFTQEPGRLMNQNNGSSLYNYEIEQAETGWKCNQVTIWGEPTKKKIKRAIIEAEFLPDDEKKLINDYNAFQAGELTDFKYRDNYFSFLQRRKAIKEMVDNDELIPIIE